MTFEKEGGWQEEWQIVPIMKHTAVQHLPMLFPAATCQLFNSFRKLKSIY
ncbi:hypothetical protein [Arachidicoccus terrestris]|nr:hypothetical protein [Arachidicoccus terrestris]UAY55266.1 hypothetical protein K9M52_17930 [Arachidicoccus terrestris]